MTNPFPASDPCVQCCFCLAPTFDSCLGCFAFISACCITSVKTYPSMPPSRWSARSEGIKMAKTGVCVTRQL